MFSGVLERPEVSVESPGGIAGNEARADRGNTNSGNHRNPMSSLDAKNGVTSVSNPMMASSGENRKGEPRDLRTPPRQTSRPGELTKSSFETNTLPSHCQAIAKASQSQALPLTIH